MNRQNTLAYFITPHGFGHAARSVAIMEALAQKKPGLHFHIFTKVPRWFFKSSKIPSFTYHELLTDVGLVQKNALQTDLPKTIGVLNKLVPYRRGVIQKCVAILKREKCRAVLTDISAMGIAAAQAAQIPSVLIENFTWDWIYEPYLKEHPGLLAPIQILKDWRLQRDFHVQMIPRCTQADADLVVSPVSRAPWHSRKATRKKLGLSRDQKTVLIGMGGIPWEYPFLTKLARHPTLTFLVTGQGRSLKKRGNLIFIPHHSDFHHPDLLEASDLMIGKLGYSTLAETYWAGVPLIATTREDFREISTLQKFAHEQMKALILSSDTFIKGTWISQVETLLESEKIRRHGENGALQVARFVVKEVL